MKLLSNFRVNIEFGEKLISPRPLQGDLPKYYYALVCVKPDGKNIGIVQKFKNCQELTFEEYETEKSSINHSWSIETKSS